MIWQVLQISTCYKHADSYVMQLFQSVYVYMALCIINKP